MSPQKKEIEMNVLPLSPSSEGVRGGFHLRPFTRKLVDYCLHLAGLLAKGLFQCLPVFFIKTVAKIETFQLFRMSGGC